MDKFEILKSIAYVQRDNGHEFTVNEKLNRIRKILSLSGYREIEGNLTSIWTKLSEEELAGCEMPVLVTSHIDNVKEIRHPFVEYGTVKQVGEVMRGTFDNMATNAALIDCMLNHDIPDNVIFCFNGDEETGMCRGLKEAVKMIQEACPNEIGAAIATDVTSEGFHGKKEVPLISNKTGQVLFNKQGKVRTETVNDYDNFQLFSIENMSGSRTFQTHVCEKITDYEHRPWEQNNIFFAPHPQEIRKIPDCMSDLYHPGHSGECDEGYVIRSLHLRGFSLCLPTQGPMHSDKGCFTRPVQFDAYTNSLAEISSLIATMEKEQLLEIDEDLEVPEPEHLSFTGSGSYYPSYYDMMYNDDEEIEGQYTFADALLDDPETEEFITDFIDYLEDEDDFWNLTVYAYDYVVDEKGMLDEDEMNMIIESWADEYSYTESFLPEISAKDFIVEKMQDLYVNFIYFREEEKDDR